MINLKPLVASCAISLSLVACNNTNIGSIEDQTNHSKSSPIELAIEKYQLNNGLDIVLHQDKSDPIVAAAIVYHVGSNREKPGKTGFAHFFEHMLFQDSENVGPGNFINNIGNMGGVLNGGTWHDGTIYYEVVPKNGLEKMLWMESDRMGYFINTLTQKGLETEKQVVKNEKRQRVDNQPYGHTRSVIAKALYPEGHPYSWSVIGSLKDLQSATLTDVREFYQQWYGVNNATLVLAGDFEMAQAKRWVEKYFGDLLPGEAVSPLPPMPAKLETTKSLYHQDNFAKVPELTLTFPTIEKYHKQAYALELLADILSEGKDSVFYQQVVEQDKLAAKVGVSSNSQEIAGTLTIQVRAFKDTDLDSVKQSIDTALDKFAQNGFTDSQLKRVLSQRESSFYNEITSVFNKAASIAQHNEFAGDPNLVVTEIERYRDVSRKDIMKVFNDYLYNKHHIATSFVPKGQETLALQGSVRADVVEEQIVQGAESKLAEQGAKQAQTLTPIAQAQSKFDRSVNPPLSGGLDIQLPQAWNKQLNNGVSVLGIEHNELPLVSFSIRVQGGHSLDPEGKAGVANLLSQILMEGTKNKTPQQLEQALGLLGSTLKFTASEEYITLTGNTLAANYAETMALAQEILLQPRWDQTQWQRIKQQAKAKILQDSANPNQIAANVFAKLMYHHDSMLSTPVQGTQDQLNNISLDDVKTFYQQNLVANLTSVQVAGDIDTEKVLASLQPLNSVKHANVELPKPLAMPALTKPQLYFVDVPGAKQSIIHIGQRAMAPNSQQYYQGVAVNHKLGGSFSGQLFQILRLQKGYTYGAYSSFERRNAGGVFMAGSSVRANVTLESLQLFRQIMADYIKEFDQKALQDSRDILTKSNARAFETTNSLKHVLENINTYSLPLDYVNEQQQTLQNMTLAQAKQILNQYMDPDKLIYLVVGDAKTQQPRMQQLGLGEPIMLDIKGNRL